jgi:acetyl-CoA synthetase
MTQNTQVPSAIQPTDPDELFAPADLGRQPQIRDLEAYREWHRRSIEDPEGFWKEIAHDFAWFTQPSRIVEWQWPDARWFVGGKTNLAFNALEEQIARGHGDRVAILWESEAVDEQRGPAEVRRITYRQLLSQVARFAHGLKRLGVKRGDRIAICMPVVPELAIAMLASVRLGAVHSVIFAGFSDRAIADRVQDAGSAVVITADGAYRAGKTIPLKATINSAARLTNIIKHVVVLRRTGQPVEWSAGRDVWWHDLVAHDGGEEASAEPVDSEDPLFIMYTSGSTGKPKGVFHTTAGYMVYVGTTGKQVFDLRPGDVHWCTADLAWITGHAYTLYGVLLNGATTVLYEGSLAHPDWTRTWQIIQRHCVRQFYTAPTVVRELIRNGAEQPATYDLSSLRVLGSVGEPISPTVWKWYYQHVGGGQAQVVDTWWQTETGGAMISPLPGVTPTKPGSATLPFFGVEPGIVDAEGNELHGEAEGFLVIKRPWPAMLRGVWGDRPRYLDTYWSQTKEFFFTGDAARRDADGYYWLLGRVDDVVKVKGHRLGSAEVEGAIIAHPSVAEVAVVSVPDETTGEAILAFVALKPGHQPSEALEQAIARQVEQQVGKLARPKEIRWASALPKNRGGKIMRRLLREYAITGTIRGDTTTLDEVGILSETAPAKEER